MNEIFDLKNMEYNSHFTVTLSVDFFFNSAILVLTPEQKIEAEKNNYNFDHPDAFDSQLLVETLTKLKAGKRVEIPIYNFKVHYCMHILTLCLLVCRVG